MKFKRNFGLLVVALIAALGTAGCSGASSEGSGSERLTVAVSGTVATSPFLEASVNSIRSVQSGENGTMSLALADLEIYVIYFSGTEVGKVQAAVNGSTGAWTFSVPVNSQIMAIVRDRLTLDTVGPITFVDSLNKDMSGNDKESLTFSFKSGASLGPITLSDDGKFVVAVTPALTAVANSVTEAPASALDFSGSWTLGAYSGTLPATHNGACAAGDTTCQGPEVGEPIYLIKLPGKKFSYTGGSSCATHAATGTGGCAAGNGTVGTEALHAAQIWGGGLAVEACGFKTGFSADDARAFGRIHIAPTDLPMISGSGVTTTQLGFGRVTFAAPTGYGGDSAPNNLPWMKTGATSPYDIMNCKNVQKTGSDSKVYNLNVCQGTLNTGGFGFQAMGPGGCLDTSNKPVIVKDWNALKLLTPNCGAGPTAHTTLANMKVNACTYTGVSLSAASATTFTCTNVYGLFTSFTAETPNTAASTYITTFTKTPAGTCSAILDDLQRYRCYANAYFQDGGRNNSGCKTEFRFNWQATTIADFVQVDGSRDKPKQQYLTSIVTYSPSGNSFTLEDEENESVSVQSGDGSIVCRVARKTILKGTALTSTQMLIDLTQSAFLKDSTVAACIGEKNNATANGGNGTELYRRLREGNQKLLFTLNK